MTIQFYESLAAILEAAGGLSADAVRSRRNCRIVIADQLFAAFLQQVQRSHLHQFFVRVAGAARRSGRGVHELQCFAVDHVNRVDAGVHHRAKALQLGKILLG